MGQQTVKVIKEVRQKYNFSELEIEKKEEPKYRKSDLGGKRKHILRVINKMTVSVKSLEAEMDYTKSLLSQCKRESRAYQSLTSLLQELEQEKVRAEIVEMEKEQMDMDNVDTDKTKDENNNSQLSNTNTAVDQKVTSNRPSMFM